MAKGSDGCDTLKVCPDTRLTVGDSLRESQPEATRSASRSASREWHCSTRAAAWSLAERVTYLRSEAGEIVLPTSTSARQFQPEASADAAIGRAVGERRTEHVRPRFRER